VCEARGSLAGFYQLSVDEGQCELEHLWVRPEFVGQGMARLLLAHAMEQAAYLGANHLSIDADPIAERFYLACGAVRTGAIAAPVEGEPKRVRPQLRIGVAAT
jgi:GNAT superfamily N-acetyltransferase